MKLINWFVLIVGTALIVVHGFWSDVFKIDGLTVVVFFILSIPVVAQYLKKAKLPGTEFEFKEEIRDTQKLVQQSVDQAKKAERVGGAQILSFETFNLSGIKKLLNDDPVLALAALRIEIEKKLQSVANQFDISKIHTWSVSKLIEAVAKKEMLSFEQIKALKKIVNMCNKAVHGSSISKGEAKEIINLAEELNKSFSIGYSIDFSENKDYEKHGLLCEWEHCIEWMPFTEKRTEYSCPTFGHNCPGGKEKISKCGKTVNDIPKERFLETKFHSKKDTIEPK